MKVREMLYEYKDAFSLRDEIGTCPNIEVEIDVMDKTPFFIRLIILQRNVVSWVFKKVFYLF